MKINTRYNVTVKIKLHVSPLRELIYDKNGVFVRESNSYYIFDCFRVRKANVIEIQEVERN